MYLVHLCPQNHNTILCTLLFLRLRPSSSWGVSSLLTWSFTRLTWSFTRLISSLTVSLFLFLSGGSFIFTLPYTLMAAADEETVILTTKRRELFLFDSRLFRIVDENQNNLSVYYKCNTNPSVKCGGRLIRTAVGEIIQTVACLDTCHRLSDAKIAALRARKRLFDQVRSHPHRSIRFCYTDIRAELSQINLEAVIHLDSLSTLRASLQRWRRGVIPPRPENYNSIPTTELFPEIYTRNKFGQEPFLFLDRTYIPPEGNDGTAYRVLAFMSPRSATELVNANKVLIDGTFKVAAQPFSQMFTRLYQHLEEGIRTEHLEE